MTPGEGGGGEGRLGLQQYTHHHTNSTQTDRGVLGGWGRQHTRGKAADLDGKLPVQVHTTAYCDTHTVPGCRPALRVVLSWPHLLSRVALQDGVDELEAAQQHVLLEPLAATEGGGVGPGCRRG